MKKEKKLTKWLVLITVAIVVMSIIGFALLVMPKVREDVKRLGSDKRETEQDKETISSGNNKPEQDDSGGSVPWDEIFGDNLFDDYYGDGGYGYDDSVMPEVGPSYANDIARSGETVEYDLTVSNDYLTGFEEALNTEVPYTLNWDFEHYESADGYVKWTTSYYELSGDIPNLDELNNLLYEKCTYVKELYLFYLENDSDAYYMTYDGKGTAQVIYNDENFISVLIQNNYALNGTQITALDAVNIDVKTGRILEDWQLFCPDEGFLNRFREQSLLQNGESDILSMMTDEELAGYLYSQDSCVIFFSAKGMEVGFSYLHSYENEEGTEMVATGYITITINDFEYYIIEETGDSIL